MNIVFNRIGKLFVLLQSHAFKIRIVLNAVIDDVTDDVVGLTERNTFAGEVVRQVRGIGVSPARSHSSLLCVNRHLLKHGFQYTKTHVKRIHRIKRRLFILTHIGIEGQGQPFHHRKHRLKVAEHSAGFAANLFGDIRIFLIRHDGRARAEIIRQFKKVNVLTGKEHDFFAQTT